MQAEFMNAEVFKVGLNVSHRLDAHFGLPPKRTLSQRDVPGMTRGVVPLLRAMGVDGITVGMNGGVCPPWVPMLFRWRVPDDSGGDAAEVVAGWHPGGYPDEYACGPKGMVHCNEQVAGPLGRRECMLSGDEAFCFAFRTDNTGPPRSAAEVIHGFHVAQSQFPGAHVVGGDMDAFFARAQLDKSLPVITGEIGDVWIQGVASDPWKARRGYVTVSRR